MHEYKGTYSQYLRQRDLDEARLTKQAAAQVKEVDRLQTLVDRFGAKASKASMAHSLEKRIVRIKAEGVTGPAARRSMRLRLPEPPHAGRTVLEVEGLAKSYATLDVFDHLEFDVGRGDRMLVMGLNGAGKTSLLRILAGVTEPTAGVGPLGLSAHRPATTRRSTRASRPA